MTRRSARLAALHCGPPRAIAVGAEVFARGTTELGRDTFFRGVVTGVDVNAADVQFDDGECRRMPMYALKLERPCPLPMGAPLTQMATSSSTNDVVHSTPNPSVANVTTVEAPTVRDATAATLISLSELAGEV